MPVEMKVVLHPTFGTALDDAYAPLRVRGPDRACAPLPRTHLVALRGNTGPVALSLARGGLVGAHRVAVVASAER